MTPNLRVHYWRENQGNFGDELNSWIWDRHLTSAVPGRLYVGLGTILDRHIPPASETIVVGSGAGYAALPELNGATWRVAFLRGPLTGRLLEMPDKAVTDPGILVRQQIACVPVEDRRGTIFIPHYKSLRLNDWKKICKLADVEFVDPCSDSVAVVKRIASAQKVIAESMHAAIVADALRVPWIPTVTSPEVSSFKWCDFTFSMELPYEPHYLPAANLGSAVRNVLLNQSCNRLLSSPLDAERGHHRFDSEQAELKFYRELVKRQDEWIPRFYSLLAKAWVTCVEAIPIITSIGEEGFARRTANTLREIKKLPAFLSGDERHRQAVRQVLQSMQEFRPAEQPGGVVVRE